MSLKINKKQAKEFALLFKPLIADYIKEHRAEYEAYLEELKTSKDTTKAEHQGENKI